MFKCKCNNGWEEVSGFLRDGPTCQCKTNEACGPGNKCDNGQCVQDNSGGTDPECSTDKPCQGDKVCNAGKCEDKVEPPKTCDPACKDDEVCNADGECEAKEEEGTEGAAAAISVGAALFAFIMA